MTFEDKPENHLPRVIVDTCYKIHKQVGPGLFESVYEEILFYELQKRKLNVERQKAIRIIWDNLRMELGFRADLIVENKVLKRA